VTAKWILPESTGGLSLTQFTLYYDVGQTGSYQSVSITDGFIRSYTLSGQPTGSLVNMLISASNINGEGPLSDVLTVYIATAPSAPAKPTETQIIMPDYS
jgi:hypothetical protein